MAARGGSKSNAPKARKRVEASDSAIASLKRGRNGSGFAKCEECNKDVPVVLIDFHNCSLEAKIKMNLGAQLIEVTETKKQQKDKKKIESSDGRKKTESSDGSAKKKRRLKKGSDPNMPKRPPTAFFVFMENFRKIFKEANPDSKSVSEVAKEGGIKWKSMSEEEKQQYIDRAAELKAEYEKAMESYNVAKANEGEEKEIQEIEDDEENDVKEVKDEKNDVKEVKDENNDVKEVKDEESEVKLRKKCNKYLKLNSF